MKNIINTLLQPKSIAIIGASRHQEKVGYQVLSNIIESKYPGKIYPVNPTASQIANLKSYPSVLDIPSEVEVAIIVTPAKLVPIIISECQRKKVKAVIVISAGFAEVGGIGIELNRQLKHHLSQGSTRLLGPNCLGAFSTIHHLNATFGPPLPEPGNIMLISQSGAMVTAVLDWCNSQNIGLSHAITLGNRIDISENEALEFAAHDHHTQVIMAYIESFKDPMEFFAIASRVTPKKPIILLKGGATKAGAKASASHTAALTSDHKLLQAITRQTGVTLTNSIENWLNASAMASVSPNMSGNDIAIITNAGGPGVVAADAIDRAQLNIANLSQDTLHTLKAELQLSDIHNPIDILGDAAPEEFAKALTIVQNDPIADAMLVLVTPQTTTHPLRTAEFIAKFAANHHKPIVVCFIGGRQFKAAKEVLHHYRIPTVTFPQDAVNLLKIRAHQAMNSIRIKPFPPQHKSPLNHSMRRKLLDSLIKSNSIKPALSILKAYHIQIPKSQIVNQITNVSQAFKSLHPPLIAKTASINILHKAKAGGVIPHITTQIAARHAYQRLQPFSKDVLLQEMVPIDVELIIGCGRDELMGTYLTMGLGGAYTNSLDDRSYVILPARVSDLKLALKSTKANQVLKEAQIDTAAVIQVASRLSQIMLDFEIIEEIEINPLIANHTHGVLAADIKIQIQPNTA